MDDTILIDLVDEVRADYQIPPYTPDDTIVRAVKESAARLSGLVETAINWYEDHTARELLKARTYYSLSHVLDEFEKNYGHEIRAWQLGMEVATDETDEHS
jgi:hypothetical protein